MNQSTKYNMLFFVATLFVVVGLFSCSPKELTSKELIKWVENPENGFIQEKTFGDLSFRVRYKPLNYVIAKDLKNKINDSIYLASKEKFQGLQYVNFTIYPKEGQQFDVLNYGTSSTKENQEKIYYYSFPFQKDIYIEQGGEKLPCELFHFVRDHGLSPELNFALGFEQKENKGDVKIVINDFVFGNGELNFVIKEEDIKSLPALKI